MGVSQKYNNTKAYTSCTVIKIINYLKHNHISIKL